MPTLMSETAWAVRQEFLRQLGGQCMCPCGCGCRNLRVLEVDHVANDGGVERKKLRGSRYVAQKLAALASDPEAVRQTLQILCANCHAEKTRFGACTPGGTTAEDPRQPASMIDDHPHEIKMIENDPGGILPVQDARMLERAEALQGFTPDPPPVPEKWWRRAKDLVHGRADHA